MSSSWRKSGRLITASIGLGMLACAEEPAGPVPEPAFEIVAGNENGTIVEVGEHRAPFGLMVRDAASQLLLYFRWDNSFCGAGAPPVTEFVLSTFRDIIRIDESWQTLDKTEGFWFYVYDWNGTPAFPGCGFLRANTPIAVGRGHRLLHDNDFYPIGPYGPGPGANTYLVMLRGSLLTPSGKQVQLLGSEHATVDRDGNVIRWSNRLQLSPDPRQ